MADTKTTYDIDLDGYVLDPPQQEDLDELLRVCRKNLEEVDENLVSRAFKLCYVSHEGIERASGEPYYYHPVAVAKIVASEINIDDVSVVASLLHDTVEDTEVTLDDIKEKFGDTVSHLIDGVTKISGVFKSRNTKQAETFMKMLLSMAEDIRVVLIKFADRLHNMRTIQHLPREKQMQKATETMELYAPLAHRFGLFNIKSELEDLCFKVIDPNSYKFIARKLREKKEAREAFIEEFMDPIDEELDKQGFTFEMKGRPKHIYSIFRKMQRQQKPFEEIYDLFAIRIILEEPHTKEDCWRVYSIITDWYTPIPKRFRDFISVPKANGYQSLHTTVITKKGRKVEVQIRTRHMDDIAEKGVAAHWKYKEGKEGGSETLEKFVHWVRDVLDNPRPDAATEFVKDFQLNLYQDEIYVFTPDGELRTLPQGATPIDFAFDIHSEIGERAIAAKINGKMAPLRQKLDIGDQVEIITGNKINLNPDWINDVVTHKAKSRIRQYIKQKERQTADEGREIWEKRAKRGNIEISEQDLTRIAQKLKFDSTQDLFYDIGKGSFDVNELYDVVKQFTSKGRIDEKEDEDKPAPVTEEEIQETYINAARSISDDKALVINGELTNVKYSYANCCNPIPGDDVMGFISRTGDVKVHRSNCKNIHHLIQTDGERIVDVSWAKNIDSKFLGAVKVIGEDRVGMINDITDILSKSLETNMKSINVNSDSGMFEGILTVYVDDIDHLGRIVNKLQNVGGVKSVFRYE
ncbi:RelA/SpoT family protein [Aliifodinibius salipaludis]|uniref:RelA/SpoT family protein n=1 Tax=Fodinibius salipaludis TaxID=2032627 RepID=A0A2A2G8Q6_9BACT|nr:bifunctional (p)ppGpp synthetase/guanosine-3',5'-bis(diphosphate) 3'-pyrophosphohydrolase [Aliifodinibius salipaludis]PAU93688.1 RelA/SpoT family protein [Aliifodinibius salipaludis]